MTEQDKVTVDDIIGIVKTEEQTNSVEEVRKLRGRENKTAKRFTTDNGSNEDVCLVDNLTKKEYESNFNDIVDLMNKIWEQTQRFEKHNQDLTEENEQLKEQNADWETAFDNCKHYKEAYGTEIVKIKQTIKDMMENERTELGRSVLKQLWEAIQ